MSHNLMLNPFFMLEFNRNGVRARDLKRNACYKKVNKLALFIVHGCLSDKDYINSMSEEEKRQAQNAGILVNKQESKSMLNWEEKRWSRAAYLTFSQQDIDYSEPDPDITPLNDLNQFRREVIEGYKQGTNYPENELFKTDVIINLFKPEETDTDIDALMRRVSTRSFSKEAVPFNVFSSILFETTKQIRIATDSQASGDALFIFNSFYCWVKLYIYIQNVENIEKGLYQYDPLTHQLRLIRKDIENNDVYPCIQLQKWIQGGGFCVFLSANWDRYMWIYRHSRAYINLLIQAGEFGQELYVSASKYLLSGWGTPAVHESKCAALIGFDRSKEDVVYFFKIGVPTSNA